MKRAAVIAALMLLSACEDRTINREVWPKPEEDQFKVHSCRMIKWEHTGKKKYCGKACWSSEIRRTYQCDDGVREVIE